MSEAARHAAGAAHRDIESIERGYEYLLAYAAQGRQDDAGTELRETLERCMPRWRSRVARDGRVRRRRRRFRRRCGRGRPRRHRCYLAAVERDAPRRTRRHRPGAGRRAVASLLVDNLNASVHLRALLTDLFLLDQALGGA